MTAKQKYVEEQKKIMKAKKKAIRQATDYDVEALMTCFALANYHLYNHKKGRILKSLQYIDDLMCDVRSGAMTIDDYKKELEEKTGVRIVC